jgi:Raf kinase inhibitor-like YbhB/YbcL family protein
MLEKMPAWFGSLLKNVRAGHSKLTIANDTIGVGGTAIIEMSIELSSPAFHNHGEIPARYTADGDGTSPPLIWGQLPDGTESLALIVEDADAPAPKPLVHALLWDIAPDQFGLAEGAISSSDVAAPGIEVGRNSFMAQGWLPPDPPAGHGSHDYVFQLFALSQAPTLDEGPGRSDVIDAMRGRVIGAGMLVGT